MHPLTLLLITNTGFSSYFRSQETSPQTKTLAHTHEHSSDRFLCFRVLEVRAERWLIRRSSLTFEASEPVPSRGALLSRLESRSQSQRLRSFSFSTHAFFFFSLPFACPSKRIPHLYLQHGFLLLLHSGSHGFSLCTQACDMSSEFKLVVVNGNDREESELSSLTEEVTLGERVKINDFRRQGNGSISNVVVNTERRAFTDRFSRGKRAAHDDSASLPVDVNEKREHGAGKKSGPLLSGTAYCISSCSMILLNKVVLSGYNFNAGASLMFYQNLISSVVVVVLGLCRAVSVEKLNWKLIRVWLPVNVIFIGMLVSSMYSLKYINIAMVTILKNMTNILTAIGELYIFQKRQNQKVWTAMFLMIISAVSGGITDLSFDAVGYAWQIMNCILTASYSLTLRRVMDEAKKSTRSGSLNEISMVLLNNLLSLPFAIFLIILLGEWEYVKNVDATELPMFWVVATASGLLGLAISFTSMWFLHQTSPTTYSLVGSLNKIPISVAGLVLFKVPLSLPNFISILFGLFAGVIFARTKLS